MHGAPVRAQVLAEQPHEVVLLRLAVALEIAVDDVLRLILLVIY